MPGLPWYAYAISAVILGGGLVWFFWRRLKKAETDAWRAASLDAKALHDADVNVIEREVRAGIQTEKAKAGPVTAADWSF